MLILCLKQVSLKQNPDNKTFQLKRFPYEKIYTYFPQLINHHNKHYVSNLCFIQLFLLTDDTGSRLHSKQLY